MPLESPAHLSFDAPSDIEARTRLAQLAHLPPPTELLKPMGATLAPNKAPMPAELAPKQSLLNFGVNKVTSRLISDTDTREQFNHYGCEFLKTASLFAGGKVGIVSTFLTYGADQAKLGMPLSHQVADFTIGGLKGEALKGMFAVIGARADFAPTKGALMGLTARSADLVFSREMFTDTDKQIARLQKDALNRDVMYMDAGLFVAGEALFTGTNAFTKGSLTENKILSGMVMGGSFGFVNGTFAEAARQTSLNEPINLLKVLKTGGIEASVAALGAGFGMKASDPVLHAKVGRVVGDALETVGLNPRPTSREFVVTGGMPELHKFTRDELAHTVATVREVKRFLGVERVGSEKQILVAHPQEVGKERPLPQITDFIASCNPEKLGAPQRAAHLFPEGRGPLFMELGQQSRMRISLGDQAKPWAYRDSGARTRLGGPDITINVMAPLMIGNPHDVNDATKIGEWKSFEAQLAQAKKLGVDGVSTDVWWGLIEPKQGQFKWGYYDQLSTSIIGNKLNWVPIMSLHACGGNVGDTVNVPVPTWVWSHVASKMGSSNPDAGKYVSEQGNVNHEFVQAWSTDHALPLYRDVMTAFKTQYAGKAHAIPEVNISLGPAGEARYPSYNSHDKDTGWPHRGALQCYSEAAKQDFKEWAIRKYGDEAAVKRYWGDKYGSEIGPPKDVDAFYKNNDHHNTQYGRDFFDWYSDSLIGHGKKVLGTALDVYGPGSAFEKSEIGFKLPGVHWRMGYHQDGKIVLGDRLAELNAGLIRTSQADWVSDDLGRGYRPIIRGFADLMKQPGGNRLVLHFTCLEMADGVDGAKANSLPYSLAKWVGREAQLAGLPLKGENALGWNLPNPSAWHSMASHLDLPGQQGQYRGLTLLRLSDVLGSDVGRTHIETMINAIKSHKAAPAETAPKQNAS